MNKFILISALFLSLAACKEDDLDGEKEDNNCTEIIFPSETGHVRQQVTILSAEADEGHIHLKIGISGCDLNRKIDFNVSLFMLKTMPPQRDAWFTFTEQPCDAYFETDLCFDRDEISEETKLRIITPTDTTMLMLPKLD
jgi:hypothetical protein